MRSSLFDAPPGATPSQNAHQGALMPAFGQVPFARLKAAYDELRAACRAEGTPRIQMAIDEWEPLADYAFQRPPITAQDMADVRAWMDVLPSAGGHPQEICRGCHIPGKRHKVGCPYA